MVPSLSFAVALSEMFAGAVNVAPLAGALSDTDGGWLGVGGGAGTRTVTLSNSAVAACPALWLVTSSPTYSVAPAIVAVPTAVHVTPSLDWNPVTVLPRRSSRTHTGAPVVPTGPGCVTSPVVSRR